MLLKVGGGVDYRQEEMPQQQVDVVVSADHTEVPKPHHTTIETPIGSVEFADWFGVVAICTIILVIGIVKKYFWNSSKEDE